MTRQTTTSVSFTSYELKPEILQALSGMGFAHPTPIQAESLPMLLKGRDVIGQANTGTGKTAAFGIPIIQSLKPNPKHVQALILAPTRELSSQVNEELAAIGKNVGMKQIAIFGGVGYEPQVTALRRGVHVVVGTPGRIMDLMRRGNLDVGHLRFLVLDEADRMLDMGFVEDVKWILQHCPGKNERQTMLFSATMPDGVRELANHFMRDPFFVSVVKNQTMSLDNIEQAYYSVGRRNKLWALTRVLDHEESGLMLIFCATKRMVDRLVDDLQAHGYGAEALHGDMTQRRRQIVLERFKGNKIKIMVATDVAARGLDIDDITHVINYDLPDDPEVYIHRIGRTGRMGRPGKAVSFVSKFDRRQLELVQTFAGAIIELQEPPEGPDGSRSRDRVRKVVDWEQISDKYGNCHFELDVGSKQGATMVGIHKFVRGATRISDHLVGNIRVGRDKTQFEVPKDTAMRVLDRLRKSSYRGRRVSARLLPQH